MRPLAPATLLLFAALAACDVPPPPAVHFRLITLGTPESFGMSLRELPPGTLEAVGLRYGLGVVRLGAAAERAGLRVGDVVYGVNQRRIASLEDMRAAAARPGPLSLLVRRGAMDLYVLLDDRATGTLLRT